MNVFAVYPQKLNRMTGTFAQGIGFDDLDGDNFDHTGLGFIGGGCVSSGSGQTPIAAARVSPPDIPRWGSAWKEWQQKNANSWGSVYVQISRRPVRGELPRPRPDRPRPARLPGRPRHVQPLPERAERDHVPPPRR